MILLDIIRDHLDSLLHPSARRDPMTRAQHRAFIAPRLFGSLAALASLPLYLAVRGAPADIEVMVFAWLIAPILVSYFLSRTGRFESAHLLSSLSLAAVVLAVCIHTGGISSFAAIWLVAVPLEAALSSSRRVVAWALALALGCALVLVLVENLGGLPPSRIRPDLSPMFEALGICFATLYAAMVAFSAESLARTGKHLLDTEEERYRLLALNISDVISRHSANGDVRFVSPAAETLLGVPVAQLFEQGLFHRVHVADRPAYLTALSNAARGREAASVEFRVRRDTPEMAVRVMPPEFIWVEMRCRPFEPSAGPTGNVEVVAVMRDVTERKLQQQAVEAARAEAERANESKSRFLATMSHELRTPLNAIIGFSEMIVREQDLGLDAAKRREYAQLVNESGQHLLSVVNGILDMSKMESGSYELEPEPFSPREVIVSCCNLLALKARDGGVELATRVPADLPQIVGDAQAFKQIVLNLVSNSIKFTEHGGSVTVCAGIEGSRFLLRVIDTGVGIGIEDLKRIGEPFFQAGKTYQRRHEGTGLGISIVKSLVALHGGDMLVHSKVAEGTTIAIALPVDGPAPAPEPATNIATFAVPSRVPATDIRVKKSA